MSEAPGISRRRFLQLGAAAAVGAGAAAVGLRVWRGRGEASGWEALFGPRTEGVQEVGRRVVEAGLVTSVAEALAALPSDGLSVDGSVEVVDAQAFGDAVRATAAAELEADDLVDFEAYLFAPSELSLAALVHLSP